MRVEGLRFRVLGSTAQVSGFKVAVFGLLGMGYSVEN